MTPARSYLSTGFLASLLSRAAQVVHGGEFESLPHRADRVRTFLRSARESISPLEYLEATLHPWVAFLIMPLFALANAGVVIHVADLTDPISVAVAAGLFLGKPVGILLFSVLTVKLILKRLPQGLTWASLIGAACLAGIGFTMALFIAALALQGELLEAAKIGVLLGSALSAALGMALLFFFLPKSPPSRA